MHHYLVNTLGSFWVYEDQDGNEFTRRAVEGEEIAGELYQAFEYEPAFENWEDYQYHIHPTLIKVDDTGVKFHIGDAIEKAYKKRLTTELQKTIEEQQNVQNAETTIEVSIENQDVFYMLPFPITLNEEWDTIRIRPTLKVGRKEVIPDLDPELAGARFASSIYFTILESGKIIEKETVETPERTFEDCLKIEYRTETVMPHMNGGGPKAGESTTTVWLAENVGIVKFHREANKMFQTGPPGNVFFPEVTSYVLKNYEIKSGTTEGE